MRAAWFALGTVALLAFGLLGPTTGETRAFGVGQVYGFPTAHGFALLQYQGLFSTVPVTPGSLVFGDIIWVEFLNLLGNRTVTVTVDQRNGPNSSVYQNGSFSVGGLNVTVFEFDLTSQATDHRVSFCVDGGCESFSHQTPVTLIPSGVLNVGGLVLLIFGVTVETFILIVPLTAAAAWIGRKAKWSPKGTLFVLLGTPHVAFAVVVLALFDYPALDAFFAGTEFLLFPFLFALFYFVWALHLFNRAEPALVLRPDPQGGHRLRYNAWAVWLAETDDGARIIVGTRWRDWLSRLCGHYSVVVPTDQAGTAVGLPAESPLTFYHADRVGGRAERFRARPGRSTPLDDFEIGGDPEDGSWLKGQYRPKKLLWVDSDGWLDDAAPRLSFHRTVKVPAVVKNGEVVVPATTKERLTWPHYVDPPAGMRLAGIHYLDTPVAAVGWIRAERAYKRVEELRSQVGQLRATTFTAADDEAERQMAELLRSLERERAPLSDLEAVEETRVAGAKTVPPSTTSEEAEASERPGAVGAKKSRAGSP